MAPAAAHGRMHAMQARIPKDRHHYVNEPHTPQHAHTQANLAAAAAAAALLQLLVRAEAPGLRLERPQQYRYSWVLDVLCSRTHIICMFDCMHSCGCRIKDLAKHKNHLCPCNSISRSMPKHVADTIFFTCLFNPIEKRQSSHSQS